MPLPIAVRLGSARHEYAEQDSESKPVLAGQIRGS